MPLDEPHPEPSLTARGVRTRAKLIAAARIVFERDGYRDTRLTDITVEARLAKGSFYTYFANKEQIFQAVLDDVTEEMLHPEIEHLDSTARPAEAIATANLAYLRAYERNAQLMRLLEEVATVNPQILQLRQRRAAAFSSRNARSIRRLQARGSVDPDIDPAIAATALSAMVSRMAFIAYVLEAGRWDTEELAESLTRLWLNALKIPDPSTAETPA